MRPPFTQQELSRFKPHHRKILEAIEARHQPLRARQPQQPPRVAVLTWDALNAVYEWLKAHEAWRDEWDNVIEEELAKMSK